MFVAIRGTPEETLVAYLPIELAQRSAQKKTRRSLVNLYQEHSIHDMGRHSVARTSHQGTAVKSQCGANELVCGEEHRGAECGPRHCRAIGNSFVPAGSACEAIYQTRACTNSVVHQ